MIFTVKLNFENKDWLAKQFSIIGIHKYSILKKKLTFLFFYNYSAYYYYYHAW